MTDCLFCGYAQKYPRYRVYDSDAWLVYHVWRRWPTGSVYIFSRQHYLFADASSSDWAAAAPVFAATSRMLMDVARAHRTYLLSFSEGCPHFHFAMLAKRQETSERYDGKRGVALLSALIADDGFFEQPAALEMSSRFREVFPEYLSRAETRPSDQERYLESEEKDRGT